MIVAQALEHLTVPIVTVSGRASLAETARAMNDHGAPVALVRDGERGHGLVSAGDLLRFLATAPTVAKGWASEVALALGSNRPCAAPEERLAAIIERMRQADSDYLLVTNESHPAVLSFAKLVQFDNTLLRREIDHLQTYIEALHDAPND